MAGFTHVKRCLELADRDIAFAMEERLVAKALLDRLAVVSRPNDGGPKILLIFARMASQACDWIDGDLRIEIAGDQEASVIDVLTDMGAGMRERVFAPLRFNVPIEELARAVERVPHMIEPLTIAVKTARKVVLSATEGVRKSTMPPPMVEIDRESLYDAHPQEAQPKDLRAPAMPSFEARLAPSPPAPELALPSREAWSAKTPEPGPLPGGSRSKVQIVKKTAPFVVKAPSAGNMPVARPVVAPAPSAQKVQAAAKVKATHAAPAKEASPEPARAAAAGTKRASQRPSFPSTTTVAATPAAKSLRPSPLVQNVSKGQKGKSQRPGAPSKPPRGSLSEPSDEETIDTGWDED